VTRRIEFSILFDLQTERPFGLWVTDNKVFDHYYIPGYEAEKDKYREQFGSLDFCKMDWRGFWDYWTSQGGYTKSWSGPFIMEINQTVSEWAKQQIGHLDHLINFIKSNKLQPVNGDSEGADEVI
jgi:hypothetical protein